MNTKVKTSYYNFIFEEELNDSNNIAIYNARTGALAVLEPRNYNMLKEFLKSGKEIDDVDFFEDLVKCGYLIPDNFDEKKDIEISVYAGRFDSSKMSLTIAPTMACNFRCIYCFEKGQYSNQFISDETIEHIFKYIKSHAASLHTLDVTWYGGEPLLAFDKIEKITNGILDITKEYNIEYSASIVTNGYLIDKEKVKKLRQLGVNDIQITIDGTKDIHDIRRPFIDGSGTFDIILHNLIDIKGLLPVYVRINVDYENYNDVQKIVQIFRDNDLTNDIIVYLGLVTPSNGNYEGSKCLAAETYSIFNLSFMKENSIPLMNIYPAPKSNYCGADHYYSYVIDPLGDLYKCWSDIGILGRKVGNIKDNVLEKSNFERLNSFLLYRPTQDERCKECKYLPICMGGCPYYRLSNFKICDRHKYDLDLYMKECVKILLEGGKENEK